MLEEAVNIICACNEWMAMIMTTLFFFCFYIYGSCRCWHRRNLLNAGDPWKVPKATQTAASVKPPSFAVQEAAKVMSASIGVDPADVMSVMSLTGCGSECAIKALSEEDGDVVNAVMRLTET